MAWQCILSEVIVKGFKNCCISSAMDEIGDDALWDEIEENGNVRWSVRKMKALTVKMQTVALVGIFSV